ncbi:MAG: MBL fold metallo-hydrolase [Planctomycetota bacterium]
MTISLTFLGTSAGQPVKNRNVTAQALRFEDGSWWLIDCGEATQHQVREAGLRAIRCGRILITHLHGDHCWGLPGMLMAMAIAGRTEPVQLAGPRGLARLLDGAFGPTGTELPFALDLHELDEDISGTPLPQPPTDPDAWRARPITIRHRVPCVAWLIEEPPRPGRVRPERAEAAGLTDRRLLGRLQRGESVQLPDGRMLAPADVLDPPPASRRLLLCGDTDDADATLAHARGVDLVVREATYAAEREAQARSWGHSTAQMTGRFAAALQARRLIITHLGGRHSDGTGPEELRAEAAAACPGIPVEVADDFKTVTM